jgi:hypothetical protein
MATASISFVSFSLAEMSVSNRSFGTEKKVGPKSILTLKATVTFLVSIL